MIVRRALAATACAATLASPAVADATTAEAAPGSVAATNGCIFNTELRNIGADAYVQVDRNGTMHANSHVISGATNLAVCDDGGKWFIHASASSGWAQDVGWANNIVLAHILSVNPADLLEQFVLGCVAPNQFIIRARGNTLDVEPTTPGDILYAQGRQVDRWTVWTTDDPRLRGIIGCTGTVAGGAWN